VKANRIIAGGHFTSPVGNPDLPLDREKHYRRSVLEAALTALSTDVAESTVFNPGTGREG
jgi:glycine reductase